MLITDVAISQGGDIFSLPKPNRHHHIIQMMAINLNMQTPITGQQGFLTKDGAFIGRKDAAKLAKSTGQAKSLIAPPRLYSEDIW